MVKNAAFLMFHTKNLVMMLMRADGRWGFPGGKQEDGETIAQAALRECKEEIHVQINEALITYQGSHEIRENFYSHFFTKEVSHDLLIQIFSTAMEGKASHAFETNGAALFDIDRHDFYSMNLAPTVIDELEQMFGNRMVGKK